MLLKLRNEMKSLNIDAMLITNIENEKSAFNLYYTTGFKGSSGFALIGHDFAYLVTDFRYKEAVKEQVTECEIIIQTKSLFDELKTLVEKHSISTLHIDPNTFYFEVLKIKEMCDVEIKSFDTLCSKLRQVKEQEEINAIKSACEITDRVFSHLVKFIKPGMTEIEISNELERVTKEFGASKISFESIVASGPNGALPHARPSERKICNGDLITLDFGCYYNKYASDMTRTIAVGEIDSKLEEIYNIVLEAQLAGVKAVKAGVSGKEVDKVCRDIITNAGYGEYFKHGTGHGLGLDVHELPSVSPSNDKPLEVGNVVTVEPGIYIPGLGGVRIEDDVLVTADGCEILNKSDKNLIKI